MKNTTYIKINTFSSEKLCSLHHFVIVGCYLHHFVIVGCYLLHIVNYNMAAAKSLRQLCVN